MAFDPTPVRSDEALRAVIGHPEGLAVAKAIHRLDKHCRRFIELSPFLCLGSADGAGRADISPRGDRPGFVRVLDDRTLLIPERPGNARIDSLTNILENPNVALIFIIPGFEDTLRVNGTAEVTVNKDLLAPSAVDGRAPKAGIIVTVEEAFLHCAKAFRRSRLWSAEPQVDRKEMPSLARIIMEQVSEVRRERGPDEDEVAAADRSLEEDYRTELY
ncbi:pyridoxamine 5'-phosphate oxidase family protein [Dongia soli]|uniref:Pyridoxamine 5'-phosphate oxidase family protein n=1 Tax=Dongia soli TaxID=600628 RepID=A0ABU5EHP1_9PROT|nr:pyridoxamine 5'-phosphate oxidase family protein [Dongia soli]MDY0885035.1 pyridoxamine 5'-phosphate oxidase family protein [Dongia soli]